MAGVYVIYRNRLFGDAVRAILATHPDIHVLGATDRTDVAAAEMATLTPGVILFEEVDNSLSMAEIDRILASLTTCRLITLRLDHDGMRVWSGTWQQTVRPADLVKAVVGAGEDEA